MKFITKRNSATGKKFLEIEERKLEALRAQKRMAKELGYEQWREAYWVAFGGVSSIMFKDRHKVDKKVWKNVNNCPDEWMPRLNTKEGKAIDDKLKTLPTISADDLNQCIGFDGAPFKSIGFTHNSDEYFGFEIVDGWKIKIPKDCKEVTTTKYNSIFGKEKELA
jgi:hypothetical protein